MTEAVFPVEVRNDVTYATHDNTELQGDLYRPGTEGKYPAIVAVHGGSEGKIPPRASPSARVDGICCR